MHEDELDATCVLAAAAGAGALLRTAPLAIGVVTAALFVLLATWRGRPALALFAACLFVAASVLATSSIERHASARAALLPAVGPGGAWPASCEVHGEVVLSPSDRGDATHLEVDADVVRCGPSRTATGSVAPRGSLRVRLSATDELRDGASAVRRGDRVVAHATLAPLQDFFDDEVDDAAARGALRETLLSGTLESLDVDARHGVVGVLDALRAHLRRRIRATFPAETEGMARALVLGEDDVAPDDRLAFRRSGLSHLLAVSGMHLVIVVAGAVRALGAVLVRIRALAVRVDPSRVAAGVGVPLAFLYADVAGGSGSATRAAWMMAAALGARALARPPNAPRALGLSALAMLAPSPLAAFDLSFVLSIMATTGLLVLAAPYEKALASAGLARAPKLAKAVATTAAATTACAPVLALLGPEVSIVSLAANLVAVPFGEALALPLCLVHAVLATSATAERGAALAASGALFAVRGIARFAAGVPFGAIVVPRPTAGMLTAVCGALGLRALGALSARRAIAGIAGACVIFEAACRYEAAPRGELRVTFVDVGQGDAALVDLPDGTAMLVDAGGLVGSPLDVGERVIAPLLRARRRGRLRAVVVSHPHPDHFGGLASGLAHVVVDEVWDTGQAETEGRPASHVAWLAAMRAGGAAVRSARDLCGVHDLGGATVEVLAPCPAPDSDRGPNDNSFVLRIRHARRAFLLVGDAEHALEQTLLTRVRAGQVTVAADVLKVGHHGSRTSSTPAFVAAVAPALAVISSGVRNRFGHPHAETLLTLARAGPRLLRTDRDGAIVVSTDGERLEVRSAR